MYATRPTSDDYELLLACYRSGQVSERQWQEHLKDKEFQRWLERRKEEGGPNNVSHSRSL